MSKQATPKNLTDNILKNQLHRRLREGIVIGILALALFLVISLLTYSKSDGGWSHTGYANHIHNAGGYVGAWFADLFLYFFGLGAYYFPSMMLYSVWRAFFKKNPNLEQSNSLIIIKCAGFILVLLASAGLLSLYLNMKWMYLPFSSGGVLGNYIGFSLVGALNHTGAIVILTASLLAGANLFSGISWFELLEKIGRMVSRMFTYGLEYIKNYKNKPKSLTPIIPIIKETLIKDTIKIQEPNNHLKLEPSFSTNVASSPLMNDLFDTEPAISPYPKVSNKPKAISKLKPKLPPLSLLEENKDAHVSNFDKEKLEAFSRLVEQKLNDFDVKANVVAVHPGPVITRFELQLAPGMKASKITILAKDLARSLSVHSVRVVEIIPGKSYIGLEIPNERRETVRLREILSSSQYVEASSAVSLALGKDISGHPVVVDLTKMPHLLVAGTTGSGKSVCLNAMLLSILYKSQPEDVRLILIDPKMLELAVYEGIPHLLTPVVTDMKEAAQALRWSVAEMDRRYKLMADAGVRNITSYNDFVMTQSAKDKKDSVENDHTELLPYIVILIDEFADMMMVVGKKVEELIARIAQKARAAGIHMILATQRPSVDVITGLIKSNIPTRMSFQVSSKIDSRTILDQQGAEQLLGSGDMLYLPPGAGTPIRIHGAFVSDNEVHKVVADWKNKQPPEYNDQILTKMTSSDSDLLDFDDEETSGELDPLYDEVVQFVTETRRVSISSVQRKFKIGYNRAARIVEEMEKSGVVTPMESNGAREVLAPPPVTS